MLRLLVWSRRAEAALRRHLSDERGLTATNLVADAALGAVAVLVIGVLLETFGFDFVDEIRARLESL